VSTLQSCNRSMAGNVHLLAPTFEERMVLVAKAKAINQWMECKDCNLQQVNPSKFHGLKTDDAFIAKAPISKRSQSTPNRGSVRLGSISNCSCNRLFVCPAVCLCLVFPVNKRKES
jgi:hypothetical protein